MMLRMSRLPALGLLAAFGACGTVQPAAPASKPISSVTSPDVEKLTRELAAKGIQGGTVQAVPTITFVEEKKRKYEVHELRSHPLHHRSTFNLVRYFMAPEEWLLVKFTQNRDGSRTYVFRRLVSGPSLDADPLKPPTRLAPKTDANQKK